MHLGCQQQQPHVERPTSTVCAHNPGLPEPLPPELLVFKERFRLEPQLAIWSTMLSQYLI